MDTVSDVDRLIAALRNRMANLADEERIELMHWLMEGYCEACGSKYLPCYCTREE